MIGSNFVIIISAIYLALLFTVAYFGRVNVKTHRFIEKNAWIYALTLCVYCTAWTFYGSIGRASSAGIGYLGVYLGPTIFAPLWIYFLRRIILISRHLRITSIADFLSARYGKNTSIGVIVSIISLIIVIPYISIQLKALQFSFQILTYGEMTSSRDFSSIPFYLNPVVIFGCVSAIFAIYFGTVQVDPSEKHPGIVTVVAAESLIKLLCFLIGAFCIIYIMNDGVGDIMENYAAEFDISSMFTLDQEGLNYSSWTWIILISTFAFLFLPRQFHMAVVENTSVEHLQKAVWLTPLYFLLISLFVIPIAFQGKLIFGDSVESDTFFLNLLLHNNFRSIAQLVFIGGLAASSGMIIASLISLSIMVSNNIFLPLLLRNQNSMIDLTNRIIAFRRMLIVFIILVSFLFYRFYTLEFSLVSVGLISFAGIAQLTPAILLGMYWKFANAKGAIAGILVGMVIWAFTLPLTNLVQMGFVGHDILESGVFGLGIFRPTALFGIDGWDSISHGCFWSLSLNTLTILLVSLNTPRSALEITQSDIFLNPSKYINQGISGSLGVEREASLDELRDILGQIFGEKKTQSILDDYKKQYNVTLIGATADSNLITYLENYLSGTIGSASARVIFENIVQQKPVQTDRLFKILDQTNQIFQYASELEQTSQELQIKSTELEKANQKLKELDELKDEFISNVTHELRTPLTAIRSLSDSLVKYQFDATKKEEVINVIREEANRISSIVNQVLDLRKLEAKGELNVTEFDLYDLLKNCKLELDAIAEEREILIHCSPTIVSTDYDILKQIIINLLGNAIKFTDVDGKIILEGNKKKNKFVVKVIDDGIGISKSDITHIFDRFYQSKTKDSVKNKGTGLGLSISKELAKKLSLKIFVKSDDGLGSEFTIKGPLL